MTKEGKHIYIDKAGDSHYGADAYNKAKEESIIPQDSYGNVYRRPRLELPSSEYAGVMSAINNAFHARFQGKRYGTINVPDENGYHVYWFEIHGYSEYNIYSRDED